MATTDQAFQTAVAHHQAGQWREAEAIYRQIIEADPGHADALHLLGVMAHQRNQHDEAIEYISRAIRRDENQASYHSNLGEAYRALGKFTEAEASFRQALRIDPSCSQAHNNLGNVLKSLGRAVEAMAAYQRAIQLQGGYAEPHNNLGIILQAQGDLAGAIAHYRQAIAFNPGYATAWKNLATALRNKGRLAEALACCQHALRLDPQDGEAHLNLGLVYEMQKNHKQALVSFREALRLNPRSAIAHHHLGGVLKQQGRLGEALAAYRSALAIEPELAATHYDMAVLLHERSEHSAAEAAYREALRLQPNYTAALIDYGRLLQGRGRLDEALESYERAVRVSPNHAAAYFHRANLHRLKRRAPEAMADYREALRLRPNYPLAYNNFALLLLEMQQPDPAIECCRKGLELAPKSAMLHGNVAHALQEQGRTAEAIPWYRKSVELQPDWWAGHSKLLYALNYLPDADPRTLFEEHLAWATRHAEPLTELAPAHANDRTPGRRLRVGYVSPHFCRHAVNYFTEPLLAAHDHEQFEIFCYASVSTPDAVTTRLKAAVDHWRDVGYESDQRVAQMVRDDRIDILVDLTGHITNHRLLVFARKPAPVQVTYIGYQNTTGMSAMDYRLTDERADPPGVTDPFYTERLVRLPRSFFCYRPSDEAPPVTPLPALEAGHVTFGSFNNVAKITPQTMAAWLEILTRVPNSRLLVLAYRGGYLEQNLHALAQQQGIDRQRIELCGRRPVGEYLGLLRRADIALDSFPFTGHTTTCDSIWMGVPVVMLEGNTYASRFGGSVLANVSLEHLIARGARQYVDAAVELAGDLDRLAQLRSELRGRMAGSALLDFPGFTRNVEQAYRQMWVTWCASKRAGAE